MIIQSKKRKIKNNSGFIALMSAIIISVILLLVATNLSLNGFYSRSDILDSELKNRSSALAEACADTAILKLTNNSSYNPVNEVVTVGTDSCVIQSVTGMNPKTILTQAIFHNSYTNLKIVVNTTNMSVTSWEEI